MHGGFRESPLRLNEGLGTLETWNEDAIRQRAGRLAATGRASLGTACTMPADVLSAFGAGPGPHAAYTIDNHPWLAPTSPMGQLFETFRKTVLALDASISEEFLKLYVAYKAETNFVDVIPQKNRLLLSLNVRFHELHDPKGFARDVTNLGRWGNGNAEVGLSGPEMLPYVTGLVRQAFEKQMSSETLEA